MMREGLQKKKKPFSLWSTVYLHVPCMRMIAAEQNITQKQKQTIINKD